MGLLHALLSALMNACYALSGRYGSAILLFTLASKIVLLPVTLWTYQNGLKVVKMQPEVNFLRVRYYGQPDVIAEEQAKLFRKEGYHPLLSVVPVLLQLALLIGVVGVIREGISNPAIDMRFGPFHLGLVPAKEGAAFLWVPLVAGLSALLLSVTQNADNVLQAEQSRKNQYGTMAFTVGLSLFLGYFVPLGTALYWVASNLLTIVQTKILNAVIRPERFVDDARLKESRAALAAVQGVGADKREGFFSENRRRERADYKRFFSVVNKHLVFYSESSGYYKYFRGFIEYLLQHTNLTIHYITSDPKDAVFAREKEVPQLRAYYIGENRLITLMMKMDADVVVMTMPDLENYHIKRSYVRKDIEYVYVLHGMGSINLTLRRGAVDHFDTVFCPGPSQKEEIRATEKLKGLPAKRLVEAGYPMIDDMRRAYREKERRENGKKKILIAPSWQKDNIIDLCLDTVLDALRGEGYEIIVRPHPQEVRLKREFIAGLEKRFADSDILFQTDFSSDNPILEADLVITDWSNIGVEFAFTTYRPVLFIDTPMKVMNPDYEQLGIVPVNISWRERMGRRLSLDKLSEIAETVKELLEHADSYREKNKSLAFAELYHPDNAAKAGGTYLIEAVQRKIAEKGEKR